MKRIIMLDMSGVEFCSMPFTSHREYERMKARVPYVTFIIREDT